MELRFRTNEHLDALNNGDLGSFPPGYLEDLLDGIFDESESPSFEAIDYAAGADYVWIYASLVAIVNVIALGDQINSGFEGWVKLGKKLHKLIKKLSSIAFDNDAITVLCIFKILNQGDDVREIQKVIEYETEIPSAYGYGGEHKSGVFIEKAQIYYVHGYEVNSSKLFLFGVRENGIFEFTKKIDII